VFYLVKYVMEEQGRIPQSSVAQSDISSV
jgi:hypothetical protein